ncbi:hypothetical protein Ocin01_12527 [Orchesella cincta]|uniref:Uncharacterized protein n=1 Tax=Orchesella cincta TaxID=48709 RepID=A0A1D2MM84_ORCCI|nr:hypothetical protein Ocin01_12527 [Orchesella cincta]
MKFLLFTISIFVTLCVSSIYSLNIDNAKESPCFKIEKTVAIDIEFWAKIKTSYYPLMSRLDLYMLAVDILQKDPAEISEPELYYDSCIVFKNTNKTFYSEGFGGNTREYTAIPKDGKFEVYAMNPVEGEGYSGTAYTTFTDNKTFSFSAVCGDNGQMTWGVGSTTPTLPRETVEKIHEHALSLGFKKEFFTELRYDGCDYQYDN